MHAVERLNALLAVAGVVPPTTGLALIPTGRSVAAVSAWLEAHLPGKRKPVLIHAGSSKRWPSKRWEAAHYVDLARQLEARGLSVIWIGAEDDRALNRQLAQEAGVDACGAFTCMDLVALGKRAAFAITSDSAPMHVLSMAGIPVYAFFGPTDWQRSHASGSAAKCPCQPGALQPLPAPDLSAATPA